MHLEYNVHSEDKIRYAIDYNFPSPLANRNTKVFLRPGKITMHAKEKSIRHLDHVVHAERKNNKLPGDHKFVATKPIRRKCTYWCSPW